MWHEEIVYLSLLMAPKSRIARRYSETLGRQFFKYSMMKPTGTGAGHYSILTVEIGLEQKS